MKGGPGADDLARARARRARARRAVGRLREPRAVGGARSRAGARRGGARPRDGAGLRRAAPPRAPRPRARVVREEGPRRASSRACARRCAWARTSCCSSIASRPTPPSTRRSRPASSSAARAWAGSPTRSCGASPSAASRRCPIRRATRAATSSRRRACPPWLARLLLAELPAADALAFGDAVGAPAPLALRANTLRASREAVVERLRAERPGRAHRGLAPSRPTRCSRATSTRRPRRRPVRDGLFAVEDTGAQVVVELCGARAGERILDACAGLGGKSAHLAALAGERRAHRGRRPRAREARPRRARPSRGSASRGVTTAVADLTRPLRRRGARASTACCSTRPAAASACCAATPRRSRGARPTTCRASPEQQRRMLDTLAPLVAPGRRARLLGVHVRPRRVRGRRRGLPARRTPTSGSRPPPPSDARALGAPHRRRGLRHGPGRIGTTPTRFSRARLVRLPSP